MGNYEIVLVVFSVFVLLYSFVHKWKTTRLLYLLIFSLCFYYRVGGHFVLLLALVAVSNYLWGLAVAKNKVFCFWAVVFNLSILSYFKIEYFSGFILPVGISFYIFQAVSYVVDVARGEIEAETNVLDFSLYLCFFPQLISGPIVRAKDFLPQIKVAPQVSFFDVGSGFFLILAGLVKKTVISDYLSLNLVDRIFSAPNLYGSFENLLAVYAYSIQIYCDFSGYSDMAIGVALLLGFRLPINFRSPFQAQSVTEFWRRWHISLSSFLRDYLYIPLGGNRKGSARTFLNLMLTMIIGGLWHGVGLKFMLWGAVHGIALCFERIFRLRLPPILSTLITFHFIAFTFMLFRAPDVETAFAVVKKIGELRFDADLFSAVAIHYKYALILMFSAYFVHFIPENIAEKIKLAFIMSPLPIKIIIGAILLRISYFVSVSGIRPFIYFQF